MSRHAPTEAANPAHALAAASAGALVLFGMLASRVAGRAALPVDVRCQSLVQSRQRAGATAAARVASVPGYPIVYLPAALGITHALRRRGAPGYSVAVAGLLGWGIHHAVKLVVTRERPPSRFGSSSAHLAFPSGHTTPTTAIALTSGYVAGREGILPVPAAAVLAVSTAAAVGISRVWLDEHWLTDVVGGWLAGTAVAAAASALHETARH